MTTTKSKKVEEVFDTREFGKIKVRYVKAGKSKYMFINLGRTKKKDIKKIETLTAYSNIEIGDKLYFEIWVDKVKGKVIGLTIIWE